MPEFSRWLGRRCVEQAHACRREGQHFPFTCCHACRLPRPAARPCACHPYSFLPHRQPLVPTVSHQFVSSFMCSTVATRSLACHIRQLADYVSSTNQRSRKTGLDRQLHTVGDLRCRSQLARGVQAGNEAAQRVVGAQAQVPQRLVGQRGAWDRTRRLLPRNPRCEGVGGGRGGKQL